MKYILDTNIISELIAKQANSKVLDFVSSLDQKDVYLSVVTIGEIKSGIENVKSLEKKQKLNRWFEQDLLVRFENKIVSIDVETMLIWGKINQKLKSKGKSLPIMDSLIASSCINAGFTLVTRNEKDFQNLDINVINPF